MPALFLPSPVKKYYDQISPEQFKYGWNELAAMKNGKAAESGEMGSSESATRLLPRAALITLRPSVVVLEVEVFLEILFI